MPTTVSLPSLNSMSSAEASRRCAAILRDLVRIFSSAFIKTNEVPHFLETVAGGAVNIKKPVVPVGLKQVPLDGSANLGGLEQLQIFRDRENRWFSRTNGHVSDAYADQLVAAMLAKLKAAAP